MARLLLAVCLLAAIVPASLARGLRAPGAGDAGDCQSCIAAVEAAEALLSDPAVETMVVQFFDQKVCPALGDLQKCHNLAQGLVPVVLQWVKSSTSPAGVCSAADFCGTAAALRLAAPKTSAVALQRQRSASDSTECAMCKFVITRVQAALNDTTVQEQVKEEMLKVCQDLPAELAGSCTDFVNTYEPLVTDFINHAQSSQLCAMVGVCMHSLVSEHPLPLTPGMARVLQQLHDVRLTAVVAAAAPAKSGNNLGDACDVCKMAVIEAHSLVSNPTVQADLVNYTKTVCEQFQNYANICKSYVDQYAPFVFNLLQQYLQPDLLCSEFGVCKVALPRLPAATGVVAGAVAQLKEALQVHTLGARATRARTVGLLGPLALQRGDPRHT